MKKIKEFRLYRMTRNIGSKDNSPSALRFCAAISSLDNIPIIYAMKYCSMVRAQIYN
jgi:hypothetical protein